ESRDPSLADTDASSYIRDVDGWVPASVGMTEFERRVGSMKALVLGAGIAGITTAYELNRDGHDVTVIDREAEPASFTSYSNAGLFAPGHAYAWSSPAAPKVLLRSLWRNDQALRFKPSLDRRFWSWMWKFWNECTAERARANTIRKVRLCNYSQS